MEKLAVILSHILKMMQNYMDYQTYICMSKSLYGEQEVLYVNAALLADRLFVCSTRSGLHLWNDNSDTLTFRCGKIHSFMQVQNVHCRFSWLLSI